MPKKVGESWFCNECGRRFPGEQERAAIACEEAHNTIYVKFTREELFKLIQFIMTGDISLVQGDVLNKLLKYKSGKY